MKKRIKIAITMIVLVRLMGNMVSATGWYDTLGTNKSLGSPLLDSDFQASDFSPAEIIIFGIFLSNYTVPFVDNYESAYSKTGEGSNGYGYDALKFTTACNDEVLTNLLSIVIANEFTSIRPVKIAETGVEANLGDIIDKNCNILENVKLIVSDANNNNVVIYDSEDEWDNLMLDMSMAVYSGFDKSRKGLKSIVKDNIDGISVSALSFDMYGNIVVKDRSNDKYVVVIPAATNQHLTRNKSYNLLTSAFMSSNFMSYSNANMYFESEMHGSLKPMHSNRPENIWVDSAVGTDGYRVRANDGVNNNGTDNYLSAIIKRVGYKSTSGETKYQNLIDNDKNMNIEMLISYAYGWLTGIKDVSGKLDLGSNVLDYMYTMGGGKVDIFEDDFDVFTGVLASVNGGKANVEHAGINTLYKYTYSVMTDDSLCKSIKVDRQTVIEEFRNDRLFGSTFEDCSESGKKVINAYAVEYCRINGLAASKDMLSNIISNYIVKYDLNADVIYKSLSKGRVIEAAEKILDIKTHEGINAEYVANVYVTYLKWYGLTSSECNILNTDLFDVTGSYLEDGALKGIVGNTGDSDEQAKENVKKLLNTGSTGAEARKNMVTSTISSTLYDWYSKIVKNNNTGFLEINNLENNRFIGNIVGVYADIVLGFIAVCLVVMIITMIIKKMRVSWLVITLMTVINIAVMIPSISEILPLLSQTAVESIFRSQADEWALAESVSNRNTYDDLTQTLGMQDAQAAYELINEVNSIYNDKSLTIKQDISKKVTGTENTFQNDLLKYKSTQWLLPRIMRQYTDGNDRYVYVTYNEIGRNAQRLYWLYNDSARLEDGAYGDETGGADDNNVHEKVYKINAITDMVDNLDFSKVLSILRDKGLSKEEQNKQIEGLINSAISMGNESGFISEHANNEVRNSTYDIDGTNSEKEYGYFWTTETLYTYFYSDLRDKFGNDVSVEDIKNYLLGYEIQVDINDATGKNKKSLCINGELDSKYVDSIVDLDYVISDVIPYMYKAQLIAGGINGNTGVLEGMKLSNYNIYKDNDASWMYRCNWVTKLVENRYLNKEGEKGLDINNYENKDIVTSEYEMNKKGLGVNDLSSVESKLVNINYKIYRRCMVLLNNINTDGIEVNDIVKQMALIATTEFNKGFNGANFLVNSNKLYPTGVDLRNVSFDSIMRLVIINSTNDYSVVYGNVMKNVIENSDIFSGILVLLVSLMCVYVIPLLTDVIMMFIFVLGIAAMIVNVIGSVKTKAKVTMAYIMDLLLFVGVNIGYYIAVMCLINTGSLISISKASMKLDTSSGAMLILLIITLVYVFITIKCIQFMFKNWRDAGASIISEKLDVMAAGIKGTLNGLFSIGVSDETLAGEDNKAREVRERQKLRDEIRRKKMKDRRDEDIDREDERKDRKEKRDNKGIAVKMNNGNIDNMEVQETEEEVASERDKINRRIEMRKNSEDAGGSDE